MTPRSHPEEASARRDAILDAALELFAERGFHGTAVPLVAERAQVGAGTLYRYFDSKEALVNALYQREKALLASHLMQDFPVAVPPRQQFHAMWKRLWEFAEKHPQSGVFLELHHHAAYLDETSRQLEQEVLAPMVDFVRRGQEQQAVKALPPELLIHLVYGAFVGLAKAIWSGQLEPGPSTLDDAEACLWEAVRL